MRMSERTLRRAELSLPCSRHPLCVLAQALSRCHAVIGALCTTRSERFGRAELLMERRSFGVEIATAAVCIIRHVPFRRVATGHGFFPPRMRIRDVHPARPVKRDSRQEQLACCSQ